MEMKMEEKLSVVELLKRASKLLFRNINLAFFLFLCSLPLFCFLIFFELSLQTTISLSYHFLFQQFSSSLSYQFLSQKFNDHEDLSEDLIPWLIQTSLLYFIPYNLLDLLTTTTVVAASSLVYTSEKEPLGLLYLVRRTIKICQNQVRGCLITSLYVLLWSTCLFFGVFSDSTSYLFIASLSRNHQSFRDLGAMLFHGMVVLIHGTVFIVLTAKFSKWSAGWNMAMVVSVLEEDNDDGQATYGSDALSLSAWYGRGHEKRDLWMMLVFLVLTLVMRIPCLYSKCSQSSNRNGLLYTGLYVGLICVGNVVRWVVCVVCYHDCKTRVDVEQAKPPAT